MDTRNTDTPDWIKLEIDDGIFTSIGNTSITNEQCIWEAINNSIQKAEDTDKDLNVVVEMCWNAHDLKKIEKILITDQSGGIDIKDIQKCLSPARRLHTEISLSEHGMGLNLLIQTMTRKTKSGVSSANYVLTSYHDNGCYVVNDNFSFKTKMGISRFDDSNTPRGLHLEFNNFTGYLDFHFPSSPTSKYWQFWAKTCAKYRRKYNSFIRMGKKFNIQFVAKQDEKIRKRDYVPVEMILKNPVSGKREWITTVTLKDDVGNKIEYKLGAANMDRDAYEAVVVGSSHKVWHQIHPYRIGATTWGFDTLYHDVVIEFTSGQIISESLAGGNWQMFSGLRGEKIIHSGGESYITKNGIKYNSAIAALDIKAVNIFKGKEKHPALGEKINFFEKYVHRKHSSKRNIAPEKIVKHRHRMQLEDFGLAVVQEHPSAYGIIDMICDNVIYEHKIKKSKVEDVLQCFKYLIGTEYKESRLYAPEHSDQSSKIVLDLNQIFVEANQNKKIVLKLLNDTLKNPSLTEKEKQLL